MTFSPDKSIESVISWELGLSPSRVESCPLWRDETSLLVLPRRVLDVLPCAGEP